MASKNKLEKVPSPLKKGKNGTYIFVHINKTGGTSICKVLGYSIYHFMVREIIPMIGEEAFEKAFVFSVVRNPWDKVVSLYKYRIKINTSNLTQNPISFKDWVKQTFGKEKNPIYYNSPRMFEPQCDWLKDRNGVIRVNNILRFESLNEDFSSIAKSLGITAQLPHVNKTDRFAYAYYYDKETIEIVREWFKEDIERFGYEFEPLHPSLLTKITKLRLRRQELFDFIRRKRYQFFLNKNL